MSVCVCVCVHRHEIDDGAQGELQYMCTHTCICDHNDDNIHMGDMGVSKPSKQYVFMYACVYDDSMLIAVIWGYSNIPNDFN